MSSFIQTIQNIFKIEELRTRIISTILMLIVVRIGAQITLPGIDVGLLLSSSQGGSNAAIFALGVMPYITSSIIMQLGGIVIPEIQKMQKEGEEGRRKITQYTRILTVLISALQSWAFSVRMLNMAVGGESVVPVSPVLFTITTILLLTAGTVFLMWIGEQITERGIGNGISLIIMIGIVARLPAALLQEFNVVFTMGERPWIVEIIILLFLVFVIAAIIYVTQGARKIPVQYAKRQIGRKVYGGSTQYIPLRVNTAGVMPIIFAQALMFIPNTVLSFFPESESLNYMVSLFSQRSTSLFLDSLCL